MATWELEPRFYSHPKSAGSPGLRRSTPPTRLAIVVSLILVLVGTAPYWSKQIPLGTEFVAISPEIGRPPDKVVLVQTTSPRGPRAQARRNTSQVRQSVRRAPGSKHYVVSFGSFSRQAAAETTAREIRGKGYHATVTHVGGTFHVVSRSFQDRHSAEFWSKVYSEIGLRTHVLAVSGGAVNVTTEIDLLFIS